MKMAQDIIIKPIITEDSMMGIASKKYTFKVASDANKLEIAKAVKKSGATMLRGGAFKPRTSPYDFQGLKADGIEILLKAKKNI